MKGLYKAAGIFAVAGAAFAFIGDFGASWDFVEKRVGPHFWAKGDETRLEFLTFKWADGSSQAHGGVSIFYTSNSSLRCSKLEKKLKNDPNYTFDAKCYSATEMNAEDQITDSDELRYFHAEDENLARWIQRNLSLAHGSVGDPNKTPSQRGMLELYLAK